MTKAKKSDEKLYFQEHEAACNMIVKGDVNLKTKLTRDEFLELAEEQGYTGVVYNEREQWLKDNGHAVTRENMVNHDLTVAPENLPKLDSDE